ncbi:MAG TPA: glycoside hydrolase family 3 N-terminal domain-containing protein [Thermoanaerobaculia bacterium]|nr:glycoside hydrolase family 3 N-terminal domain-containing protein [Thermoanaerobaculia bacterium]
MRTPLLAIPCCFAVFSAFAAGEERAPSPETLSAELLAGQMIGVGIGASLPMPELERWVRDRAVGAVVLYRASMPDAETVRELTSAVHRMSPRPELTPLIATDQEGGAVIRLAAAMLPGNLALAATGSPEMAERAGRHVGCVLRQSGINVNFAPTIDVVPAGDPAGIGTRSFGSDPVETGRFAVAYVRGLDTANVLAVAKHFPGHGSASGDSHNSEPADSRPRAEIEADLIPFEAVIAGGVAGVMAGHVRYSNWRDTAGLPASLSPAILRTLLRDELGFDGLIFTDVIHMEGVAKLGGPGELAVRAIEAGADVVLASGYGDRQAAYGAILAAIRNGRLTCDRVHESVRRVLRAKSRAATPPPACTADPNLANEVARSAITLLGDRKVLPIEVDEAFHVGIAGALADRFPTGRRVTLPVTLTKDLTDRFEREVRSRFDGRGPLVVSILNRSQAELARRLRAEFPDVPLIVVVLGFPGDAAGIPATTFILAYNFLEPSQRAAVDVLAGKRCGPGRLPVDVPGLAPAGAGDETCVSRR